VYKAHPDVLIGGDAHKVARRVGCIKPIPGPPHVYWITLGRSTTDHKPSDLAHDPEPAIDLDKKGWWSMRFKHTIAADVFGNEVRCRHLGELSGEACKNLLDYYEKWS